MASGWLNRLQDTGTEGTLALSLALGHELGIFNVIVASPVPMTSVEIAEKGKLKERYVREWLGSMVAGEVIQTNGSNPERYYVAEDHKGALNSLGIAARLFASYAVRYDAVKACFRQDGPNADGIDVVDYGCGTGVLVSELARRFPNSRFHGSDISAYGVAIAQQQLANSGLTNVIFSCDDLEALPDDMHNRFDWALTYDVIHDLPHPLKALNEISKSLKPGGLYVMGDIHTPKDRCGIAGDDSAMGLYGMSTFLCLPASAGQDGALGPGAAWSVEEAQALIAQSDLQLVKTEQSKPYFAVHICRRPAP